MNSLSLKEQLFGQHAFYKQENDQEKTIEELANPNALMPPVYMYKKRGLLWRIFKDLLSILILPIGIYRLVHYIGGKTALLPSSNPKMMGLQDCHAYQERLNIRISKDWKIKRITVQVGSLQIDGALTGKAETLGNGRWVLILNGNGGFYENKLHNASFRHFLKELNANALVFNYPGVGASTGSPNRFAMKKTALAMLSLLEDEDKGIGAEEIITYGHSIGAGVQADALLEHKRKKGIRYVFIKSRTFSSLAGIASQVSNKASALLIRIFGWNMNPFNSSKKIESPEIILQTCSLEGYSDLSKIPEKIIYDGIIPADYSLAKRIIEEKISLSNKYIMGVYEDHYQGIKNPTHLCQKINEMLKEQEVG